MLQELEKKVTDYFRAIEFPNSKENILIAVSGGADSIALFYVLHFLTYQNFIPAKLYCAHINHQLRADADSDEDFAISLAHELNIPVTTKRLDIKKLARDNKLSIETAARHFRIEKLIEIAKTNQCNWIATGHQKNDNAETVIHRILRGTGFRGLAGIWPLRKFNEDVFFVRPLLCVTREEIVQYLKQKNLNWREDYTNAEFKYTRNHIRHRLLPALQKQCKNSLVEQLSELSIKAESLYKQICNKAGILWPEVSTCDGNKILLTRNVLSSQFPSIQIELIRRALSAIGSGERDLTSEHYEKILELSKQGSTRKIIQLPNGFDVYVEYEHLVFNHRRASYSPANCPQSANLIIPGQTVFNEFTIEASIIVPSSEFIVQSLSQWSNLQNNVKNKYTERRTQYSEQELFDLEKIKQPLIVRFRKEGDRFIPFGQKKEKKIGKFLTAQHITEEIRNKTFVIADSEKIIWLCPIRSCEQTKVTSETRKILQLKITFTKDSE